MKATIEQIEKNLNNNGEWTITVICPQKGAIIVINNAFTANIVSYRKINGEYKLDKEISYSEAAKTPLMAMINAHNNSVENQKEADEFFNNIYN